MPAARRSTSGARSSQGKQSTLSFNNRVTKSVPKSKTLGSPPSKQSPLKHVVSATEDEPDIKDDVSAPEPDAVEEKTLPVEAEPAPSEAEVRAAQTSDRQIDQYWRKVEDERKALRVHQEDLSVAEKVLRYFDVSSQYGVSVTGVSSEPSPPPKQATMTTAKLTLHSHAWASHAETDGDALTDLASTRQPRCWRCS